MRRPVKGLSPAAHIKGMPACWRWKLPDLTSVAGLAADDDERWYLMCDWQDGQCAMCGKLNRSLRRDHDHASGLARGLLCPSCNAMEGNTPHTLDPKDGPLAVAYGRYRLLHPARICGLALFYAPPETCCKPVEDLGIPLLV